MNYRQWKKKYKKKHGYNPPVSEDKRKRAKIEARMIGFSIDEVASSFLEGLASVCEAIRNSFANAAENFKCAAEDFRRK